MPRFMFRLERDDGRARLILDRPEARNAIPASGWARSRHGSARWRSSDARLLVVTGAGGSFCAGADLADFAAMRADPAAIARFREDDARRARPAARAAHPDHRR